MRRFVRLLGALLILGGTATLAWTFVVWRWEDPFTSAPPAAGSEATG